MEDGIGIGVEMIDEVEVVRDIMGKSMSLGRSWMRWWRIRGHWQLGKQHNLKL